MNHHFVSVFRSVSVTVYQNGRLLVRQVAGRAGRGRVGRRRRVGARVAAASSRVASAAFAFGARAARCCRFSAVLPPGHLDEPGAVLFALPPQSRRDRVVARPLDGHGRLVDFHRLFNWVALAGEEVARQGVQDVDAVHQISPADGDVHRDDLVLVGLVDLQRRFQHVQEVRQLVVADVLGALRVELLPDFVVHVVVVVRQTFLHVFRGLRVVLQNDGDVHVDDDQERDDQVREEVSDAHGGVAAIARVARFRVRLVALLLVDDAFQDAVPAGRRGHLEEQNHGLAERFKVVDFVDAGLVFDVHEEGHAEDGVDEHDQKEEEANVEQGRQGHGQGEQKRPDAFGSFDQTQDSSDFGHSDDTQQSRRHEILFDEIAEHQTCKTRRNNIAAAGHSNGLEMKLTQNGEDDDDKVEKIPRLFEVVEAQSKDFEAALGREDDDEEHVEVIEDVGQELGRFVLVQRHGEHVEADEQHNDHVEFLVGHDLENDRLRPPLEYYLTICLTFCPAGQWLS